MLPGAPTIYQSILDHPRRDEYDMSTLRIAITGAAPVPVSLVERMQRELSFDAVLTAYGQTEAVVATMCRVDDDPVTVSTSSGRATAGFEVRIGDKDEILLRGPNVMLGYLDDPEATAAAIDPDGWLHTGDVGVLDERGYLDITDRLKDMYISGGFNVYPAEVEAALLACSRGTRGRRSSACPTSGWARSGGRSSSHWTGSSPQRTTSSRMPRRNSPTSRFRASVRFVDALPRNPSGKVLKNVLREEQVMTVPFEPDVVTYEVRDGVAIVTLNRPDYRNAQNSVMTYALDAAFERAVEDDEVKVIVLAGNGKHFSAGHDLGTPGRDHHVQYDNKAVMWWDHVDKAGGDQRFAREIEVYLGMCRRWREIPKPIIAPVHGACIAGGLMLAWVLRLDRRLRRRVLLRSRGPHGHPRRRVLRAPVDSGLAVREGDPLHRRSLHRAARLRGGHGQPRRSARRAREPRRSRSPDVSPRCRASVWH